MALLERPLLRLNSDHTRFFRRSIKRLIPIELSVNAQETNPEEDSQELAPVPVNDQSSSCNPATTNR